MGYWNREEQLWVGEHYAYLITKTLSVLVHSEHENSSSHSAFSLTEAVFWLTGFDKVMICVSCEFWLISVTWNRASKKLLLSEEGHPEHQEELTASNIYECSVKVADMT